MQPETGRAIHIAPTWMRTLAGTSSHWQMSYFYHESQKEIIQSVGSLSQTMRLGRDSNLYSVKFI